MQMERTIILNDTDLRAALALPLDTATTWRRPIEDMVQRGANGGELLRVVPSMLINRGELFDAQYNLDKGFV